MASSTQRSREHRARKREGWACFKLWLPLAPLGGTLVRAERLADWDRDVGVPASLTGGGGRLQRAFG